jgi:hypothetical protein
VDNRPVGPPLTNKPLERSPHPPAVHTSFPLLVTPFVAVRRVRSCC